MDLLSGMYLPALTGEAAAGTVQLVAVLPPLLVKEGFAPDLLAIATAT